MRGLIGLLALLLPSVAGAAEVVSQRPETASVVIYRDPGGSPATREAGEGVAMVIETRTVELSAGPNTIRFRGVADTMVAQTAAVEGLPTPVDERNFDYDLLTPASLVARSIGQTVRLVRTLPGSGRVEEVTGVIRSAPAGVLIETAEGVEALRCSGLHERLVFDRAPPGLADTPTLSLQVSTPRAGRYRIRLSYLATQFNWSTNYVARVLPDGRSLQLHGWLTLANQSRTSFPAAPTYVVAGRTERSEDTRAVEPPASSLATNCWPAATWAQMMAAHSVIHARMPQASFAKAGDGYLEEIVVTGSAIRAAEESNLGDLKLYTLPEPTEVAAQQIKQVAFLHSGPVPFDRVYTFRGDDVVPGDEGEAPEGRLSLRFRNEREKGLGVALPAGSVAVMQDGPDGLPRFIGERGVKDTPVGLPVELSMNTSRDVLLTPRISRKKMAGVERTARTLDFLNTRATPVIVEVQEDVEQRGFKLVSESGPHTNRASDLVWSLELAPHGRATLRYSVDVEE